MDLEKLMEIWPLSLKDRKHNQRFFQTEPHNTSVVYTPEHIVENMLDLLPKEIWSDPDITFLNLFCKDGIFLEKIYWRLFDGLKYKITDFLERSDHILTKQLYGLSPCWAYADVDELTPSERSFNKELYGTEYLKCYAENSRIMLYGTYSANHKYACTRRFNDPYGNIWAMYKNVDGRIRSSVELVKDKGNKTIRDLVEGVDKDMKFDVVIGNPPYNKGMDLDFVNLGFDLCTKYCVMITPAKWQTAADDQRVASKTIDYKGFRKKIVPHMSKVVFYPDCNDIFDIKIKDGISYFILDKQNKVDKCTVLNKCVRQKYFDNSTVRDITNRQALLNVGNDIVEYIDNRKKEFNFPKFKQSCRYRLYCGNLITSSGGNEHFLTTDGKTLVSSACSVIDTSLKWSEPSLVSNKLILCSDNRLECESLKSWLDTKFVRFFVLLNISKFSNIMSDDYFRFVPAPPPTASGNPWDHIYTDEELYKAFNLPQKYIDVIEAVIKERK